MEDPFSVKLSEEDVARAYALSRKLGWLTLLIILTVLVSVIASLVLRGKISNFNPIVNSYLMPALHSVSPDLWRFINYAFTTNLRYGAEYLLVGWSTSVLLGIVAAYIAISAVRQINLSYYIWASQEQKRRLVHGLGAEFLMALVCLALAAFMLFITHQVDLIAYSQGRDSKWQFMYVLIPIAYPMIVLFLAISAIKFKIIYLRIMH